jgi:parallel beta-helix repeat protein
MREKKLVSSILIGVILASLFAGVVSSGAGVSGQKEEREHVTINAVLSAPSFLRAQIPFLFIPTGKSLRSGVDGIVNDASNETSHQAEQDNGTVSAVNVTASTSTSTTCDSCSDCSNKLNGKYDTVILSKDLIDVKGSCITFGASNVGFDGNGHKIDGDDTGEFDSGITMTSKSGNKIKNCEITDFESGITLYGASGNEIYNNKIHSNYYDGIWISTNSDSNNIHDNQIEDNGEYGVYLKMSFVQIQQTSIMTIRILAMITPVINQMDGMIWELLAVRMLVR